MKRALSFLVLILFSLSLAAFAQDDEKPPVEPGVPQVTYETTWQVADPQWYQFVVDSKGIGVYRSIAHGDTSGEPSELRFKATQGIVKEIFDLTKDSAFFDGDFTYKGSIRVADTGMKTLTYKDGQKTTKASFNHSENKTVMSLAALFQQMSTCFELGRRLDYARRFDKLGIDQQLKHLEQLQREGALPGVSTLEPILQKVLNDPATMNISRQRAQFLLFAAKNEK